MVDKLQLWRQQHDHDHVTQITILTPAGINVWDKAIPVFSHTDPINPPEIKD